MATGARVKEALDQAVKAHREAHHDHLRAAGLPVEGTPTGTGQAGQEAPETVTEED